MADVFYQEFITVLREANKEKCITLVLGKLQRGEISVPELYKNILERAQTENDFVNDPQDIAIWKEHVRTAIVRSVLENAYPYVIKERNTRCKDTKGGRVLLLSPKDEVHEIGLIMVSDYFTMAGFDVIYVGINTPWQSFLAAIKTSKPAIVAISITNPYHLFKTKKTIDEIRFAATSPLEIIVGGQAFANQEPEMYKKIGADKILRTFEDICKLGGGKF